MKSISLPPADRLPGSSPIAHRIRTGLLITLLGCQAGAMKAATDPNALAIDAATLNQWAEEMRTNHPALRAAGARLRAAGFNTNSVRAWEDPMFRFGGNLASPRGFKPSEGGDLVYGLEQKVPVFGKERAARRVAVAGAVLEETRLSYQFQTLRRDLTKGAFDAAFAARLVEIGEQDLSWLQMMGRITADHLQAGTASQVDYLRIQNEHARRADQLRTDRQRLEQSQVILNRLLGRSVSLPWPRLLLPPPAEAIRDTRELMDYAKQTDPKLRTLEGEIGQARALADATRHSRRPDVSLGIEGRQFSGDGGFREGTFLVGVSVPWLNFRRYQNDVSRDLARVEAAQLDAADYLQAVSERVRELAVAIDAARRAALLNRQDILPRSELALSSAHANWQAGRGVFNDNMEARRMLLEAQLGAARAITDQYELLAELALLCGAQDLQALQIGATSNSLMP